MSQANSEAIFQQAHDLYNNGKHNEALVIFDQHLEMKKELSKRVEIDCNLKATRSVPDFCI